MKLNVHEQKTSTHGVSGDIVGTTSVQTLSNKTLTGPIINDAILTGWTGTVTDATTAFVDDSDPTKIFKLELGGLTTATTRTATPPDADFVMMSTDTVQTVTGAKTFGSAGAVSKLKVAGTTSGAVTINTDAVAGTAVVTVPAVTDTLVGKATTDTLTNKTLTAPVLSGTATGTYTLGGTPTITAPAISSPVFSGTVTGTYTLGGTPTISSPSFTGVINAGAVSATAGNAKTITGIKAAIADATATDILQVSFPNVSGGALLQISACGALGDGDSAQTVLYNIAFSRISGANALIGISAAVGAATTTGATANAATTITAGAVSGAVGVANTFAIKVTVTRSAGASTNHTATFTATLIQNVDGGFGLTAL